MNLIQKLPEAIPFNTRFTERMYDHSCMYEVRATYQARGRTFHAQVQGSGDDINLHGDFFQRATRRRALFIQAYCLLNADIAAWLAAVNPIPND